MMIRRDHRKVKKEIYHYQCSITGEGFKTTAKAKNEGDLISVAAYYQLHPELDDRPEHVKKQLAALAEERLAMNTSSGDGLAPLESDLSAAEADGDEED